MRYKIKYWTLAVAPSNLYTLIVRINKSINQATKIVENGPKGDFQEIGNRFLGVLPNIKRTTIIFVVNPDLLNVIFNLINLNFITSRIPVNHYRKFITIP